LLRESNPHCSGLVEKYLLQWMQSTESMLDTSGVPIDYPEIDFLRRLDNDSVIDIRKNELSTVLIYHPIMGNLQHDLWEKLFTLEKNNPYRKTYLLCLVDFSD
jgi:hypothetical protein